MSAANMKVIKAPSVGESITEVRLGQWKKQNGQAVKTGEVLLEIESDKATVEVVAEYSGKLTITRQAGETVGIGEVLGQIEEGAAGSAVATTTAQAASQVQSPAPSSSSPASAAMPLSPAVRKTVADAGLDPQAIAGSVGGSGKDGRLTKGDVFAYQQKQATSAAAQPVSSSAAVSKPAPAMVLDARSRRVPMPLIRQKIAERLVHAQSTAAILTTFNECDMTAVMALRNQHKDGFKSKYGVALSFMSFFTRACVEALKAVPAVNAFIDGKDFVYNDFIDMGIAVGTERGLVVPVVRDVGSMGFVEIEKAIGSLAVKARDGKLSIKELSGGTFTISNGGVYGSLLSTPILNPPQSGILGMHKIQERPMAINGKVEVRPMMFLALSYDHRIIDGKEAVTFLIKVKEGIEKPETLGLQV